MTSNAELLPKGFRVCITSFSLCAVIPSWRMKTWNQKNWICPRLLGKSVAKHWRKSDNAFFLMTATNFTQGLLHLYYIHYSLGPSDLCSLYLSLTRSASDQSHAKVSVRPPNVSLSVIFFSSLSSPVSFNWFLMNTEGGCQLAGTNAAPQRAQVVKAIQAAWRGALRWRVPSRQKEQGETLELRGGWFLKRKGE